MKNIDAFSNYLEYERNYSNNTILAYQNNLEQFESFCKQENIKNIKNIDYNFIRKYMEYLYKKNYTTSSINRMLSVLRSFFKYLNSENKIEFICLSAIF